MIPLGPILGVAGIAAATILVPMAVSGYNGMITERETSRIEVALSRQANEYETKMRANADKHRNKNDKLRSEIVAQEQQYLEKINEMSRTIEIQMDNNPLSVDADIARELFVSMCEASSGYNLDARKACRVRAAEADLSRYSPVFSITAETIDNWRYLCEETGSDDYCKPHWIGLRPHGILQAIGYIRQMDTVMRTQDANFDTVVTQINEILAMPGPTITKE